MNRNSNKTRETVSRYFLMAILFLIVMTVLFMIGSGREVPETLAIPFSMIISYLLGVKTPEKVEDNANQSNSE
jgi:hypothetical protein